MNLRELSGLLYRMKIVNQELTAIFEKETGFSLTRYQLLQFLNEQGRCTQNQVQNELKIDSAAVTRHLKILEEKQFVTRERNKDNNREIFVSLTPKAQADLASCASKHSSSEESLGINLTEEEEAQLLTLLMKLVP
ncbi:DNA-binding transcriptional regulator, MarR family [Enterococcus casseliflavus]|uniref:MarR family winged helix-turn-helix transcriptional regulator n=1 Tax=Enterococcus casseliflavus TaxID=37734 RepID=UPI0008EB1EA1|nr:MarR family winged helix-turn-helix transcriptional regulator [Enterococcus casseliflavus]SFD38042.1 DNA-binding transcriptional regulator, MarR family [Enterococcus casseliflavus]